MGQLVCYKQSMLHIQYINWRKFFKTKLIVCKKVSMKLLGYIRVQVRHLSIYWLEVLWYSLWSWHICVVQCCYVRIVFHLLVEEYSIILILNGFVKFDFHLIFALFFSASFGGFGTGGSSLFGSAPKSSTGTSVFQTPSQTSAFGTGTSTAFGGTSGL